MKKQARLPLGESQNVSIEAASFPVTVILLPGLFDSLGEMWRYIPHEIPTVTSSLFR